jgi:hypothetical protein
MIFGMTTLTFVHVVLSLIGIGSGLVVAFGLLGSKRLDGWTAVFLTTTVATSVTGSAVLAPPGSKGRCRGDPGVPRVGTAPGLTRRETETEH